MAKVTYINPHKQAATGAKLKKKRKKTFKKRNRQRGRGTIKMATKRKRKSSRRRKNPNPFLNTHKKRARKRRNPVRRFRARSRRRRNPETGGDLTMGKVGTALAGVAGGLFSYKMGTGLLGMEGNGKYLGGAGIAVAGYWLLKKVWPGAAMPFAIAVGTLVINDYLSESGLLDGLSGFLGNGFNASDVDVLSEFQQNYQLSGMVPNSGNGVQLDQSAFAGINDDGAQ